MAPVKALTGHILADGVRVLVLVGLLLTGLWCNAARRLTVLAFSLVQALRERRSSGSFWPGFREALAVIDLSYVALASSCALVGQIAARHSSFASNMDTRLKSRLLEEE